MILDYHVGHVDGGTPVTLGELGRTWAAVVLATKADALAPKASQLVEAEERWRAKRASFIGPMALSDEAARELVLHNLQVEIDAADRGGYVVGGKVLEPSEVRALVARGGPPARPLIALGRQFAKALVTASGFPL